MAKVTLLSLVVFLVLALHSGVGADSDESGLAEKRRDSEKKYSSLWFGPRIGRRKRNPSENIYKTLDRDEIEALAGQLKNPWPLMTVNNVKRQMDFTPRLGRDSMEEFEERSSDYEDFTRKPHSPRLGRRYSPYSPRLGRENDILLQ